MATILISKWWQQISKIAQNIKYAIIVNSIEEKDKDVKISEVEDQKHNKNEGV